MKKFNIFCLILICITLATKVAFVFSNTLPWADDLYYWYWFHNPFFSYPDHPPLIGYFVGLSVLIFGHHIPSLALGGIFLYLFLTILGYFLAANLFIPRSKLAGILFATMVSTVPYFAGISVIMSPDTVLAFFAFLTLFAYHNAFFREPFSLRAWLLAGILLSLALFSKLTTIFIGGAIFLYACLSKNRRQILSNPRFYISFFPSVFVGIVLLISDASHDWIMLKYTAERGSRAPTPKFIINFAYNQLKYYSPYFFIFFYFLSFANVKNYYFPSKGKKQTQEVVFFFSIISAILLGYLLEKRIASHLQNWWSGFAIHAGFIVMVYYIVEHWKEKKTRIFTILNLSWCVFFVCLIVFHSIFGSILYEYDPKVDKNPIVATYNKTLRDIAIFAKKILGQGINDPSQNFYSFNELKDGRFADYYKKNMNQDLPIVTNGFIIAAYLNFFINPKKGASATSIHHGLFESPTMDSYNIYDLTFDLEALKGKDIYLIFGDNGLVAYRKKNILKNLPLAFEKVSLIKKFYSHRKGLVQNVLRIYHCQNYRGKEYLLKKREELHKTLQKESLLLEK